MLSMLMKYIMGMSGKDCKFQRGKKRPSGKVFILVVIPFCSHMPHQYIFGREMDVRQRNTYVRGGNRQNMLAVVPFKICTKKALRNQKEKEKTAEFPSLPVLDCLHRDTTIVKLTVSEVFSQNLKAGKRERTPCLEGSNASWGHRVSSLQKKVYHLCFGNIYRPATRVETLSQCFMSPGTAEEFLFQLPSKRGQMTLAHQGIIDMLNWQEKNCILRIKGIGA